MTQYDPNERRQFNPLLDSLGAGLGTLGGLGSLIDTNKFPPGYITYPEEGQPGYGGHLTQGPVQPIIDDHLTRITYPEEGQQPPGFQQRLPSPPGKIRQPWPPRLGPPRGRPRPQPWPPQGWPPQIQQPVNQDPWGIKPMGEQITGFGETLGGYGEQLGGFEETLGGLGEQMGGYGERLGGFESTLGGLGEQMGGFGEQFGNISDRLGKIEEGIAGLNKSSPQQQQPSPFYGGFNPFMFSGLSSLFGGYGRGRGRYG